MRTQRILFLAPLVALCLTMVSTAQAAGVGGKVTVEGVTVMAKTINMAAEPVAPRCIPHLRKARIWLSGKEMRWRMWLCTSPLARLRSLRRPASLCN